MSTKGRYGLRVMIELASQYGNGPVLTETIATNQGISGKYIHILAGGLRVAGLVRAVRGPSGGYELTKKPSSVTALDVITALEGQTAPVDCVSRASFCSRATRCAARDLWCEVASVVDRVLGGVTLDHLAAQQRTKHERTVRMKSTSSRTSPGNTSTCQANPTVSRH
jgi:Rrf2 family cysteine metabolism transcriptional repressor